MAAPAQTTPDAQDPSAPADPIALAAFVSRRGGRVLAYLDAVTAPDRALQAAGEAFASFRLARATDPDAEAAATTLLRATRRAATAHAENPYRPAGRERPAHRTAACDAMPRLLVAWTESRLPDADVARLVEHLQACPDCRALRDAFDRAELGYRGGQAVDLDGTEVGVIATAMALAVAAPRPGHDADAPTVDVPRTRRTAIPAAPDAAADDGPVRRTALPPTRRRTTIPAPPATASGGPTAIPPRPAPDLAGPAATRRSGAADAPVDPLGPEALGYVVPRSGLPRPERRPAVPRVRRRRRRRPPSAAVAASDATTPVVASGEDAAGSASADRPAVARPERAEAAATPATTGRATGRAADRPARAGTGSPSADPAGGRDEQAATTPRPTASPAVRPATVTSGGLATAGRRVLEVPLVRQLGVPAVLLLAVLIAALIAAGVFAGQQEETVAPITRPTIPTVPADPNDIPALR